MAVSAGAESHWRSSASSNAGEMRRIARDAMGGWTAAIFEGVTLGTHVVSASERRRRGENEEERERTVDPGHGAFLL